MPSLAPIKPCSSPGGSADVSRWTSSTTRSLNINTTPRAMAFALSANEP